MTDSSSQPKPKIFRLLFSQLTLRKKIFLWFGGGVLVLALIIFFGSRHLNNRDFLLPLAPVDSVFYASLKNLPWPADNQLTYKSLAQIYRQIKLPCDLGDLSIEDIIRQSQQLAVTVFPNDAAGGLNVACLFELKNRSLIFWPASEANLKIKTALESKSNFFWLEKNIGVVTNSESALNKIKSVWANQTFSLASQINRQWFSGQPFSLYLKKTLSQNYLRAKNIIWPPWLSNFLKDDLYLGLNFDNSVWKIKIANINYAVAATSRQRLPSSWPKDFLIFTTGQSLADLFNFEWPPLPFDSGLPPDNWLNPDSNSSPISKNPGQVAIFPATISAPVFGYLFRLPPTVQVSDWELLAKDFFAQRLPQRVAYLLPDKTSVTALVANPEIFQWQDEATTTDLFIRRLIDEQGNLVVAYSKEDDSILIVDSPDRLANQPKISLSALAKVCNLAEPGNFVAINTKQLSQFLFQKNFFLPDFGIFKIKNNQLQGCLTDVSN